MGTGVQVRSRRMNLDAVDVGQAEIVRLVRTAVDLLDI
jgi:hypothetical protein